MAHSRDAAAWSLTEPSPPPPARYGSQKLAKRFNLSPEGRGEVDSAFDDYAARLGLCFSCQLATKRSRLAGLSGLAKA